MSANIKELIKMIMKKPIPSRKMEFGDSDLADILLFLINMKMGTRKVTSIKELINTLSRVIFLPLINAHRTLNNMKSKSIVGPMIKYLIIKEFTTIGNKRNISTVNKAMKRMKKYLDTYKVMAETL